MKTRHVDSWAVDMIFHAPFLILSLRCVVPSIMIMGSATNFWILATAAKLFTLPFGKNAYQRLDRRLVSSMIGLVGYFFETWSGVEYHFYGDPLPKEPESVLYMSNHQCTVDWIIAEVLCLKQGGYGGRVHYLLKYGILYIPMYGWYLATRQNVFLKRSKSNDPNWLKGKLLKLQKEEMPIWLVIFPEGTRFNPQKSYKLERSQAYADSLGLPRLNHVLMPHTTGFEVTLATAKDRFQAIYDVTIIYEGREGYSVRSLPPDMFGFYSGRCQRVHVHLERIATSDVPDSEEERKQWLFKQFQKKDKLIDDFLTTGTIAAPKQSLPLPLSYTIPPTLIYGLLLVLAASSKERRTIWLGATLINQSLTGDMIFHAPFLLLSLRCIIPSIMILGSATSLWMFVTATKLLSLPFRRSVYHRLDQRVTSSIVSVVGYFFETWSGVEYHFYGDPLPKEPESVLYISNHQCTVDWIIAEVLCLKQGGYGGRVHYLLKYGVLYVPMYGWYLGTRRNIFLKRSKLNDPNWLKGKLLELQKKEMPMWLVIFPEGTRFDPQKSDKLERSQAYADSLGLPRLNHVLMPRTTGFEVTLATIKDNFQAIYDVTIIYEGREGYSVQSSPPNMFGFYSGRCKRVHIHLERIAISDVPDSEEEHKQWLFKQFQKKDKLIDDFLTTGTIAAPKQSLPLPLSYTIPPTLIYGLLLVLAASSKAGRTIWLSATLFYTSIGYLLIQCKFIK